MPYLSLTEEKILIKNACQSGRNFLIILENATTLINYSKKNKNFY